MELSLVPMEQEVDFTNVLPNTVHGPFRGAKTLHDSLPLDERGFWKLVMGDVTFDYDTGHFRYSMFINNEWYVSCRQWREARLANEHRHADFLKLQAAMEKWQSERWAS